MSMSKVISSGINNTFFAAFLGAFFRWFGFFLDVGICVLTLVLSLLNLWRELCHMNRNWLKYLKTFHIDFSKKVGKKN